jgi:uncharacterized protein (TIGR02118 family)
MQQPDSSFFIGKRCSLLRRRHDLSVEAFREHWAGPHATIACAMPGISRYTQNRVIERLWASEPEAYDCDGLVELEFRDEQALREANESEAVRKLLPEDEPRFVDAITLCRVPAGALQIWPERSKVMLAARLRDGTENGAERLQDLLVSSGCLASSIDVVADVFHRTGLLHESVPPQVLVTLWFDPRDDLREIFAERSPWAMCASSRLERGAAWLCDPLSVVS